MPAYRHSRVSGNLDGTAVGWYCRQATVGIPAYAGMTVGRPPPLYRRDSRLRGKDGGETAAPLSSGFPLTREGRSGAVNHLSIQTQQILSILSIHV